MLCWGICLRYITLVFFLPCRVAAVYATSAVRHQKETLNVFACHALQRDVRRAKKKRMVVFLKVTLSGPFGAYGNLNTGRPCPPAMPGTQAAPPAAEADRRETWLRREQRAQPNAKENEGAQAQRAREPQRTRRQETGRLSGPRTQGQESCGTWLGSPQGQPEGATRGHDPGSRKMREDRGERRAKQARGGQEKGKAEGPSAAGWRSGCGAGRSTAGQQERICLALRFQISNVMLECNLWNTTSGETKLRQRAMDSLRERSTCLGGVVHGHSKRSVRKKCFDGVGQDDEGHNNRARQRAWTGCSLHPLAGRPAFCFLLCLETQAT